MENNKKEKIEALSKMLETGVQNVFTSEKYINWLTTVSKFHNYSVNNTILIHSQMPDASYVAGFTTWKKLGRYIKKGQKGIGIFSPCFFKKTVHNDETDEDEEVEYTSFKISYVFDVSQTEGKEFIADSYISEISGNNDYYKDLIKAAIASSPVDVSFEEIKGGAKGYYSKDEHKIAVKAGMSDAMSVKTLIHEIAHARIHSGKKGVELDSNTKEVQAESVAFIVTNFFGIDTSDYSFGYIASWSEDKKTEELKNSLDLIKNTASELINAVKYQLEQLSEA